MRVFIGIKASKTLQNKVVRWQKEHRDLPVRWIKARNLHLTLVPPGREEETRKAFEELKERNIKKFSIGFDRIVVRNTYHVICLESRRPPKIVCDITKRKFSPHMTIARFKGTIELPPEKIRWTEKVDSITLFQSKLGSKEANYYEIEKILVS